MEQKIEGQAVAGLTCSYEGLGVLFGKAPTTVRSDLSRKPETLPPPSVVGAKGRPIWIVADVLDWIRARRLKEGERRQLTAAMINARAHSLGAPRKAERLEAKALGISVRDLRKRNAGAASARPGGAQGQ